MNCQFLFEAGYGSCQSKEKSGVIGVTQPRRVAVLATAKRVAYEMNVELGQEVGFQVRHDRKIGDKSCIKFMTDGILLREVQVCFNEINGKTWDVSNLIKGLQWLEFVPPVRQLGSVISHRVCLWD